MDGRNISTEQALKIAQDCLGPTAAEKRLMEQLAAEREAHAETRESAEPGYRQFRDELQRKDEECGRLRRLLGETKRDLEISRAARRIVEDERDALRRASPEDLGKGFVRYCLDRAFQRVTQEHKHFATHQDRRWWKEIRAEAMEVAKQRRLDALREKIGGRDDG